MESIGRFSGGGRGRIVPANRQVFVDQRKIQAGLRLRQQRIDLGALRRHGAAAETGAFEPGGRGGEPERVLDPTALNQSKSERAMEHVASAEGVHGLYGEYRRFTDRCTAAIIP